MLSNSIKERLREQRTPFYLYDMVLLRSTLDAARSESSRYGYKLHYALKANFNPQIVECIREYGFGADCVSGNEVRFAVESGFPSSEIAFAGVGKSDWEIKYALEHDIFSFNCESRQELHIINDLAGEMGKVANIALRVNPNVDAKTHIHISTGLATNKFGVSPQEMEQVLEELANLKNIKLSGLHFHIGSQITDMEVFERLCECVNSIYEQFKSHGISLEHINLGGGLGINYDDPEAEPIPNFAEYFGVFNKHLRIDPPADIHFELGRSIVGQCGEVISRVVLTKTTAIGSKIAIIDASMTELIRPALYQAHHSIENLDGEGRTMESCTISGTVCESTDTFARDVEMPELRRGDLVSIKSAGAYGFAMASRYNMHDLPLEVFYDS